MGLAERHAAKFREASEVVAAALILLSLTTAATAAEDAVRVDRIDVVQFGLYCVTKVARVPDPRLAPGERHTVLYLQNIAETHTVPPRLGTRFGLRFEIVGAPKGGDVVLSAVTRHRPETAASPSEDPFDWPLQVGDERFFVLEFNDPADLVPGTWAFELWYQGRKLLDERFTVAETDRKYPPCDDMVS